METSDVGVLAAYYIYVGNSGVCDPPDTDNIGWNVIIENKHPKRRIRTNVKVTYGRPGHEDVSYRDDTVNPRQVVKIGCSDHPFSGTGTRAELVRADWVDPPV